MCTYAQKYQPPQQGKSGHPARLSTAMRSHVAHPILHMQHTIANQAVQRLLQQAYYLNGLQDQRNNSLRSRLQPDTDTS